MISRLVTLIGEVVLLPGILAASVLMRLVRRVGVHRLPITRAVFDLVGIFPLHDHYHDPYVRPSEIPEIHNLRALPGVDLNLAGQLDLLRRFRYAAELRQFPRKLISMGFYYENRAFGPGDAECLYSMIRHFKPQRVVEIGGGHTSRLIQAAIERNTNEDAKPCRHICVEPYASRTLHAISSLQLIERRVEELDTAFFTALTANDVLFIDSSHVVRMGGDVIKLYLEIIPALAAGVLIHVHDVFTPHDYPAHWVRKKGRLWTEQYLFEALLSSSAKFSVMLAVNYLSRAYARELAAACPIWAEAPHAANPGSFWFARVDV